MTVENVRTVRFLSEQGAEDLYRSLGNGRVYVRQRCDKDHVQWLTSVKWSGGYEASAPLREGMIVRVVDNCFNTIFEERIERAEGFCDTVAKKNGPFSDEAIKQQAKAVAERSNLKSYNDWKAWMMRSAKEYQFTGYYVNWCYDAEYGPIRPLFHFEYLGIPAYCTTHAATHRVSGQKWQCVEIRDKSKQTVLEICGYVFEEDKK